MTVRVSPLLLLATAALVPAWMPAFVSAAPPKATRLLVARLQDEPEQPPEEPPAPAAAGNPELVLQGVADKVLAEAPVWVMKSPAWAGVWIHEVKTPAPGDEMPAISVKFLVDSNPEKQEVQLAAVKQAIATGFAKNVELVDAETLRAVLAAGLLPGADADDLQDLDDDKFKATVVAMLADPESGSYAFDPEAISFSDLIASVNQAVREDPELDGCRITGGYFANEGVGATELSLVLIGQVANQDQQLKIVDLANTEVLPNVLPASSLPFGLTAIKSNPIGLRIVAGTEAVGRMLYNNAVLHYIAAYAHPEEINDSELEKALDLLELAILNDPLRLDYKYWRVVVEIALDREEVARKHLVPLVERRRVELYSDEYVDVLWSLERVQGPTRQTLLHLEESVFSE